MLRKTPLLLLPLALFPSCQGVVPDPADDTSSGGVPAGLEAFRFGTFGTEGYWSGTLGLGRGLTAADFTLRDALDLGMQVEASTLPGGTTEGDGGGIDPTLLNSASYFQEALASGAVVGLVARDADDDGVFDLSGADTLGITCALCHSSVDGSVLVDETTGGAIGERIDGTPAGGIDLGDLFALADNSRALYPYLPQSHETVGGFPISASGAFVRATSTEAEVDALLRDDASFPRGRWDAIPDGIGAPTVLPALYDIRRAAPFGVAGEIDSPLDAVNAHVTLGLDPTTLLTVPGAVFMDRVAVGIGVELRGEFEDVLADSGALTPAGGYPFVDAEERTFAFGADAPVGLRMNATDLENLAGYLATLEPQMPEPGNAAARARGELVYAASCASCHGSMDALTALAPTPISDLYTQYLPTTLLARGFPYSDVLDDRLRTYDDRLVLFDLIYSDVQVPQYGRFVATPRLFGLHMRSALLHDGSVAGLDSLIDPARGAGAVHPFYVETLLERLDLVEYLTTR